MEILKVENLCKTYGKEVNEERLNDLIKTLGLENRINHLPNELSGG